MMRRLRTLVLIVSAIAFAVVGGVAAASALLPTPPATVGQEASQPAAGASFALGAAVADPDGGPQWTVRTYPSKTGWTCAEAGQTDGKIFGRVGPGDELQPLELPELGSCADVKQDKLAIWVNHYPADAHHDARAVIFGAMSTDVTRVALTLDGAPTELSVAHGGFIDVVPEPSVDGAVVTVTLADGSTHDTRLRPIRQPSTTTPANG